jgi:hypothetical protein
MNRIVKMIIDEMESCYPTKWNEMTTTQRAQSLSKQFHRALETEILEQSRIDAAEAAVARVKVQKAARRSKAYHDKWSDIVLKAYSYYGDMMYEYATQLWGEEGPEKMCGGAETLTDDQEEECMREALYAAHAVRHIDNPKFYDRAIAYWKKYHK